MLSEARLVGEVERVGEQRRRVRPGEVGHGDGRETAAGRLLERVPARLAGPAGHARSRSLDRSGDGWSIGQGGARQREAGAQELAALHSGAPIRIPLAAGRPNTTVFLIDVRPFEI